jgi:hypothetical protein
VHSKWPLSRGSPNTYIPCLPPPQLQGPHQAFTFHYPDCRRGCATGYSPARVSSQIRACGICGGQSSNGAGFLRVHRFPLPILIPPNVPYSSIIQGWYKRLNSGRRSKWTQSHPTPWNFKKKNGSRWPAYHDACHTIRYHRLLTYFTFLKFSTFLSMLFSDTFNFCSSLKLRHQYLITERILFFTSWSSFCKVERTATISERRNNRHFQNAFF